MHARLLFVSCAVAAALTTGRAAAQPSTASSERDRLVQEIARDGEALSSSDCAVACKAFASMQRAAERLCAIEPGPTCDDARAKVEDARRRVRASCPACAVERPAPEPRPPPTPAPEVQAASAPPAESRRGGCAGCAVSSTDTRDLGAAGLTLALLGLFLRAPRRTRRR